MSQDLHLVPQAVFGRAITFFAPDPENQSDDLDRFETISFCIDNYAPFDIRHYDGHPDKTTTLYLISDLNELSSILRMVQEIITHLALPKRAVRWRRGDEFSFGLLAEGEDRLREDEARILALKIASTQPGNQASTSYLKRHAQEYIALTSSDLRRSSTRANEQMWQQVIGNVISHHASKASLFSRGLAERTSDGLKVTPSGISYLNSIGFSP